MGPSRSLLRIRGPSLHNDYSGRTQRYYSRLPLRESHRLDYFKWYLDLAGCGCNFDLVTGPKENVDC